MVDWLIQPIPGELHETAWVAVVNGEKFAAIWKQRVGARVKYGCVFARAQKSPIVFDKLAGAKFYVEKAAAT